MMEKFKVRLVYGSKNKRNKILFEAAVKQQLSDVELVFDKQSKDGFEYWVYTTNIDYFIAIGVILGAIYAHLPE